MRVAVSGVNFDLQSGAKQGDFTEASGSLPSSWRALSYRIRRARRPASEGIRRVGISI